MTEVLTVPDWTAGNNYQTCLANGLLGEGFDVVFPTGYRRLFPLARVGHATAPLLHLHWPEPYFKRGDAFDPLRRTRFTLDLYLATRRRRLVYTAHNFIPHGSANDWLTRRNYRAILTRGSAVIAHSGVAAEKLAEFCPSAAPAIHVVPHGDSSQDFPSLPSAAEARRRLRLDPARKVVLMFGRVEPYKGLEEVIDAWRCMPPTMALLIAGEPRTAEYARVLRNLAGSRGSITLTLQRLSDETLAAHLAAADVVLFNYRRVFTSGSACLARSLGKKILLPARLSTVDLMEPAPTVFRFESVMSDLPHILRRAVDASGDPADTAKWRTATSWQRVARQTAAIYREVLGKS